MKKSAKSQPTTTASRKSLTLSLETLRRLDVHGGENPFPPVQLTKPKTSAICDLTDWCI